MTSPHLDDRVARPAFRFTVVTVWVELAHREQTLPCLKSLLVQPLVVEMPRGKLKRFGIGKK